ncbi:histidine kinase [Psychrosphaera sp. 1_MG-2023]|uniref:sensor histidine kinase n=1 Tax=Psychrosphaera sp. 1_MG-2023 TaxID=3062643 RepID=UPI0026E38257|nr:ATP-binding protein [Psychrosphaera sp. 1_MG-2023]MDO6720234.1 histidine kinase [Psychrosphaera sp. 1_MG-2023]
MLNSTNSPRHFVVATLAFFASFVVIIFMSQMQTAMFLNYDFFVKVKSFKAVLCLSALFYLSFLTKSYLGSVLRWDRFKWHIPTILVAHGIESTFYGYVDNPAYWVVISCITLIISAVVTLFYVVSQIKKIKKEWLINILIGTGLIFSCVYAFTLNVNFNHIDEFSLLLVILVTFSASCLILSSLLLLSHPHSSQREMHSVPLVMAIISLFEIFGREGFVVWWGAVIVHVFLFYLLVVTIVRINQSVARVMNMYQQGLDTNLTPYFCGSLNGRILFANQAYKRLVGEKIDSNTKELHNVLLEHPLWPEIKEKFCTKGFYKAETVINRNNLAPHTVSLHIKPLHPENDWYQASFTDLESRIEIQKNRDDALEKLAQLSKNLMEKQEEERRYFAKELHDEIGQGLTLLKIQHQLPEPDIELINHVLNELLESVRNLSLNLRPSILDDMGVSVALGWLAERQVKFSTLNVETKIQTDVPRMSEKLEISIFRIAQEAFTNIHKYAKATKVKLEFTFVDNTITLSVIDDGIGFDVGSKLNFAIKSQSLGLVSIRERAFTINGKLQLNSSPETGTSIKLVVPFVGRGNVV